MDEIYTYFTRLPDRIREIVRPCADGYTVYIEESLDHDARLDAYQHAIDHIERDDWSKDNVQAIESHAHKIA